MIRSAALLALSLLAPVIAASAPQFVFGYVFPSDNNAVPLANLAPIPFPATPVGSRATATILIANQGDTAGIVNSVSLSGSGFQTNGMPLLPATVAAGQTLQFTLVFSLNQPGSAVGTLQISTSSSTVSFGLSGTAVAPTLSYSVVQSSGSANVSPSQPIKFPNTDIGATAVAVVHVANTASVPATISLISVSGSAFQVSSLPTLPADIPAGGSIAFSLEFTPTQPAPSSGTLTVGAVSFPLQGAGLGSALIYSYGSAAGSNTVIPSGTVVFSPAKVGQSSTLTFSIQNQGTLSATIASIGLASANSVFQIKNPPPLPLTLNANATAGFTIVFTPTNTGLASDSLQVGSQTFSLSGIGSAPSPLPSYQFQGASGTLAAFEQPSVGLELSAPYDMPVNGVLTLAVSPAASVVDPAVQFLSGGRTAAFTIPAGSTKALFDGNASQVQFQTGTVAGTISFTPTFSTAGGYNLTPAAPASLAVQIPQGEPVLLSAQVSALAANSFSIDVTGYSTSRSMSSLDVQITPNGSAHLAATHLTIDASTSFLVWYQSASSSTYGSLFTVTIPFTLQKGATIPSATTSLTTSIQSISVTATNALGTSPPVSVPIQ